MKHIAILAISTLCAAPALAGNLSAPTPEATIYAPPTQIATAFSGTDSSGGYVGLRLGYGDTIGFGDVDGNGTVNAADRAMMDASGAVGGVQMGYLYDFGAYVMGAELGLNAANIDFPGGNGSVDALHTLKLKAGLDRGRTLFYGTLGAAYVKGSLGGVNYNDTGYTVGLGVDYMVNNQVSVGGDVSHHRFNDIDGRGVNLGLTTVSASVNYHF